MEQCVGGSSLRSFAIYIYIFHSDSNSSLAMCYSVRKYQAEKEVKNGLVGK